MGQYHKWPSGYLSYNGDFYEAPYYSQYKERDESWSEQKYESMSKEIYHV